jgi:hypothetical protein
VPEAWVISRFELLSDGQLSLTEDLLPADGHEQQDFSSCPKDGRGHHLSVSVRDRLSCCAAVFGPWQNDLDVASTHE